MITPDEYGRALDIAVQRGWRACPCPAPNCCNKHLPLAGRDCERCGGARVWFYFEARTKTAAEMLELQED